MAESLLARLEAKSGEVETLSAELRHARFEEQRLRLLLGGTSTSLVPAECRSGSGAGGSATAAMAAEEYRALLEWLANSADTSRQTLFHAPGGVQIGDREVQLGLMVQWQLHAVAGPLKFSVPRELEADIAALLARVRDGRLGAPELRQLADDWEMVSADVTCETGNQPAIFLVHRRSSQALVVAAWPTLPAAQAVAPGSPSPGFDAQSFFLPSSGVASSLSATIRKVAFVDTDGDVNTLTPADAEGGCGVLWSIAGHSSRQVETLGVYFDEHERCTLSGPFGHALLMDPPPGDPQRELVAHMILMAREQDVPVRCDGTEDTPTAPAPTCTATSSRAAAVEWPLQPSGIAGGRPVNPMLLGVCTGDYVEVEYQGCWFTGILQRVEGEVAQVQCDVDAPSVITFAHLSNVRPALPRMQRIHRTHMRSRSKP